jgi:predicted HTH transcriptional regulator
LDDTRTEDARVLERVIHTICAMANNGRNRAGTIIIGVADKDADASRIKHFDGIEPRKVGSRFVVGVKREAAVLSQRPEEYFAKWKHAIQHSELSSPLKEDVLSNMDYNDYYGLGLIIITVPPQKALSYVNDVPYWRSGDETKAVADYKKVVELGARFA